MKLLVRYKWFRNAIPPILVGCLLLLGWQIICRAYAIPPYVFPAPGDVAINLFANAPALFAALLSTLRITGEALLAAVVLGVGCGFLFVQSRAVERSLFPYVVLLQVTPIVSIAPLLIILIQNTDAALVLCATMIALFPIVSNTTIGLRSVDPGLLAFFRMNKIGRWQTLLRLRIPSALPFFLAGLRISSGLALIGAVVSEFVAGTGGEGSGLAYEILQSGYQLDLPRMFAALFLITAAGLGLFFLMVLIERLVLAGWYEMRDSHER